MASDLQKADQPAGFVSPMAPRLRWYGKPKKRNYMRTEKEAREVDRPAEKAPSANHNQIAKAPSPNSRRQLRPLGIGATWGSNTQLPYQELVRAILERVQTIAGTKNNRGCPSDVMDFMQRATVVFLDNSGQPIEPDRVVVAWEE